jgi:hypothetical protein
MPPETAQRFQVNATRVRAMIRAGLLDAGKLGGRLLVKPYGIVFKERSARLVAAGGREFPGETSQPGWRRCSRRAILKNMSTQIAQSHHHRSCTTRGAGCIRRRSTVFCCAVVLLSACGHNRSSDRNHDNRSGLSPELNATLDRAERERAPTTTSPSKPTVAIYGAALRLSQPSGGTIEPAAVQQVVREHMNAVQSCYERALQHSPRLAGKIVIDWVIDTSGNVSSATLVSSTLAGGEAVCDCVLTQVRSWRFPKPRGGPVEIRHPFIFRIAYGVHQP